MDGLAGRQLDAIREVVELTEHAGMRRRAKDRADLTRLRASLGTHLSR